MVLTSVVLTSVVLTSVVLTSMVLTSVVLTSVVLRMFPIFLSHVLPTGLSSVGKKFATNSYNFSYRKMPNVVQLILTSAVATKQRCLLLQTLMGIIQLTRY